MRSGGKKRSRPWVETENSSYLRNWGRKESPGKEAEKQHSDVQKNSENVVISEFTDVGSLRTQRTGLQF